MSESEKLNVKGKSGNKYKFEMHPKGTTFAAVGGVYIFTKKGEDLNNPVYVGITEDLLTRFNNHHKMDCIEENGATHISVLGESDKSKREEIEEDILGAFDFPCNDQQK